MLKTLAAAVSGAAIAAPWLGSPLLYAMFSVVCHQQPERTLWMAGAPLAVCARCTGIYAGALLGMLVRPPVSVRVAVALLALDWASEALGLRPAWAGLRLATGLLAGAACAPVVETALREA
jgi:uncharacterized membrane protein